MNHTVLCVLPCKPVFSWIVQLGPLQESEPCKKARHSHFPPLYKQTNKQTNRQTDNIMWEDIYESYDALCASNANRVLPTQTRFFLNSTTWPPLRKLDILILLLWRNKQTNKHSNKHKTFISSEEIYESYGTLCASNANRIFPEENNLASFEKASLVRKLDIQRQRRSFLSNALEARPPLAKKYI